MATVEVKRYRRRRRLLCRRRKGSAFCGNRKSVFSSARHIQELMHVLHGWPGCPQAPRGQWPQGFRRNLGSRAKAGQAPSSPCSSLEVTPLIPLRLPTGSRRRGPWPWRLLGPGRSERLRLAQLSLQAAGAGMRTSAAAPQQDQLQCGLSSGMRGDQQVGAGGLPGHLGLCLLLGQEVKASLFFAALPKATAALTLIKSMTAELEGLVAAGQVGD